MVAAGDGWAGGISHSLLAIFSFKVFDRKLYVTVKKTQGFGDGVVQLFEKDQIARHMGTEHKQNVNHGPSFFKKPHISLSRWKFVGSGISAMPRPCE